ncbi:MAG TPA: hypothetical protein VK966_06055, partial [Longimicrobiales bacterium]|nr:hypothetical protein [Longimicrobiales bacterium]
MLQADGAQLVLWERAGTLLAVPLEDVVEIAAVDTAGVARGRAGEVELLQVPGIAMGARPARAVVVRRGERFGGLPADLVR